MADASVAVDSPPTETTSPTPSSKWAMSADRAGVVALLLLASAAAPAAAQSALRGPSIRLARAPAPIVIDGNLSDEGWRGATRIDTWYETQPGDNTEPKVRNVGCHTAPTAR